MGRADRLELGTHNALCDRCGFKYKANQLKREWTGWMVCDSCWEPRHPQEFLRGRDENESVPWTRPDSDADTNVITVDGTNLVSNNSPDVYGDESTVLIVHTSNQINEWSSTLTEDRNVRLSSTGAQTGDRFIIYKMEHDGQTLYVTSTILDAGTSV